MQSIINGGIYRVNFAGKSDAEFKGDHPTLLIRTLKEEQIYLVVPLTSYTKEKMDKVRQKGSGYRIKSTNSIARIDKMQIVHKNNIKNRWKNNYIFLKIEKEELKALNNKVNEYMKLSSDKAEKEYGKYMEQYNQMYNDFKDLFEGSSISTNMFSFKQNGNNISISCEKGAVHWLSTADFIETTEHFYVSHFVSVNVFGNILSIDILPKP